MSSAVTPENVDQLDGWRLYLIAQLVQATIGQIPRSALSVGAVIEGTSVVLHFQLTSVSAEDIEDMESIIQDVTILTEDAVDVELSYTIEKEKRYLAVSGAVNWLWAVHD